MGKRKGEKMYALFSKGFGKKAQDLNKKEFYDAKTKLKLITKATTADKTTFEGNVAQEGSNDVKFTVPVDANLKIGVKAVDNHDVEIDGEFKFDDNLTLRSTVKNLDPTFKDESMRITLGSDYVTESFSVETAACVYDTQGGKANATALGLLKCGNEGKTGGSVAVAGACPGLDFLRVGFQGGLNFADKNGSAEPNINANFACGHSAADYDLVATMGFGNLMSSDEPQFAGGSLRGWFRASSSLQFGFEVDHVAKCIMQKDMYVKPKTGKGTDSTKFQLGTQYAINGSTTAKAKVSSEGGGKPV